MNSEISGNRLVTEMASYLQPPTAVVDSQPDSQVAQFYAGRCVFITGATGFIGKALIEKLIRSCSDIKRIYVLVREKKGKSIQERLKELIKSQCFDRIRSLRGDDILVDKLRAIKGDITEPKFGIEPEDMKLLASECSIVFNSAATIRFVEPIEHAVQNNIYSVGQLVEFCDQLSKLEAVVHLSTAYSNCHKRDRIHEIFYDPPMRGHQIMETIEKLQTIQETICVPKEGNTSEDDDDGEHANKSICVKCPPQRHECKLQRFFYDGRRASKDDPASSKDLLEQFTSVALRRCNKPNTYAFTKAISESYLLDEVKARPDRYLGDKIPVAIVRPSIVGAAWREPAVGLVDNFNGPTGAILSLYTGVLQAMPGVGKRVADLVPVDMVSNMVICVGWFLVEQRARNPSDGQGAPRPSQREIMKDNGVYLFNFVSGNRNPLKWELVTQKINKLAYKYPSKFLVRLPSSYFIRGGPLYNFYDTVNQKFPAYVLDFVRGKLLGQDVSGRHSSVSAYKRVRQMTETLTSFTSNQWKFCDSNTRLLLSTLGPVDKSMFHFDVSSINWTNYIQSYIMGARIYTLKDDPKNVTRAMATIQRRKLIQRFTFATFFAMFYYFFIAGSQLDISSLLLGL